MEGARGGRIAADMPARSSLALLLLIAIALPLAAADSPPRPRPRMKDFIGINGHTVQFKPELYQPVGAKVRDYHPVAWDLERDSSAPAPFPFAKNRVDWSQVYGAWQKHGWETDACLMFESMPRADWKDLEADARAYGRAFAHEFGPSGERKLVTSVEIGNEPGKWSDADYTRMFRAMAGGLREGDPRLKIASCNLTTRASGDYEKSVTCLEGLLDQVDVLTLHSYAQLVGWPTWKRSFPEDPALPHYLQDVTALCEWRDRKAPGKPVWITEFGYDSTTRPQEASGDFAKWEGVSDRQQAQWLVRSFLVFSAMPVERAYLYFFNDEDEAKLHGSSGLTRHFQPKPAFHAVAHLQKTLGDYRFTRLVTDRPGELRVQEYRHADHPERTIWAVWRPSGADEGVPVKLEKTPGKLKSAVGMPLGPEAAAAPKVRQNPDGGIEMQAGPNPVYLEFGS